MNPKMRRFSTYFETQLIASSLIALIALFFSMKALAAPIVKADGSSTVFPITEAVAEEFQKAEKGQVRVTVGISGTGGGFKKFCRGEIDVQNASRPIQTLEIEACKKSGINFYELPIAFDATVVVVNPKNTWLNEISVEELKKMWEPEAQGKVTKWKQVNSKWPDQEVKLFGAGSDSGTFDYFTEAVVGKAKASRGDYTASEDDNTVVMGISRDVNSLGYLPMAYYQENKDKLKAVAILGGPKSPMKNKAVLPSSESVIKGTYFPLSRPVFIYVSESAVKKAEVKKFVDFYLSNAQVLVAQAKYIPLPDKTYQLVQKHLNGKKMGTVFGGHSEIGLTIEELFKKESKM